MVRRIHPFVFVMAVILFAPQPALANHAPKIVSPHANADGEWGDRFSMTPSLSRSGDLIAFYSTSTNLVGGDTNGDGDIFVVELLSGTVRQVPSDWKGARSDLSEEPALSGDGRRIVFKSLRSDLVPGDENGQKDVFWMDFDTKEIKRLTSAIVGDRVPCSAFCGQPSINGDGSVVAFDSFFGGFVDGDANEVADVFVYDVVGDPLEWISQTPTGAAPNGPSWLGDQPALSDDGRYVVFTSRASDLVDAEVPGCPATAFGSYAVCTQVYLRDRIDGTTRLVSANAQGRGGNGDSTTPAISADGERVAFATRATDLAGGTGGEHWAVVLWDAGSGEVRLVSKAKGDEDSLAPAISGDGGFVAFVSGAGEQAAAYIRNLDAAATIPVFVAGNASLPGGPAARDLRLSGDGSIATGSVKANDIVDGAPAGASTVYVRYIDHDHDWKGAGGRGGGTGVEVPGPLFLMAVACILAVAGRPGRAGTR